MNPRVIQFHDGERFTTGIACKQGRRYMHIVCRDGNKKPGVVVHKLPLPEYFAHTSQLMVHKRGAPKAYSVSKAKRIFIKAGRTPSIGITKEAVNLLRNLD